MLEVILVLCVVFLAGALTGWFVSRPTTCGQLHVIADDTGEAYLFLDLSVSMENVTSQNYVTFKVTQK